MAPTRRPPSERFWDKVVRASDEECWPWTGFCEAQGYGIIAIGRATRVKAHRVSWEIHFGEIPEGMCVCHHCDNPPCVNPAHLYVGTRADNNRDRGLRKRGKEHRQYGASNDNAKLTEDDVRAIIACLQTGKSQIAVAEMFGVSQPQISKIARGEAWSHLRDE